MRPARLAAVAVAVVGIAVTACQEPTPSAPPGPAAAEHCIDLGGDIRSLAWSQTGAYLAVGWVGPVGHETDGRPAMQVLGADGVPTGPVLDVPAVRVMAAADGRPAWLERRAAGNVIVEDRLQGRREIPVPETVVDVGWTAVGYALLEQLDRGGRVTLLDPDRPDDQPFVLHEDRAFVTGLWISADPEWLVVQTLGRMDEAQGPTRFEVVGPTATLVVEARDGNGIPSMSPLRRHVVFTSGTSIAAVAPNNPAAEVRLGAQPATLGRVSDRGVLAYALRERPARLCLVDVSAQLP